MTSTEYDLRYLRAGVDVLDEYLLSNEIYWPVGVTPPAGEPAYPQLTLGGLLLAKARLEALAGTTALSNEQQVGLAKLEERMETSRTRWRVAWEGKAAKEFGARLNLWRNFLEEYREKSDHNAGSYPYEVSRRVQLHLLGLEGPLTPAQVELLTGLDRLLEAVFLPGEFAWDPALARGFPKETYWYLYGKLHKAK
jgi:hypothetical protein